MTMIENMIQINQNLIGIFQPKPKIFFQSDSD